VSDGVAMSRPPTREACLRTLRAERASDSSGGDIMAAFEVAESRDNNAVIILEFRLPAPLSFRPGG
jgi:hypothetical protein